MSVDAAPPPAWLASLAADAPDLVAPFLVLEEARPLAMRRAIRARAGGESAERLVSQHRAVADAYAAHLEALPDAAFGRPGGEAQWTVAETLGHAFDARARLVLAASLAARGRFPAHTPQVVPGVPGPEGAGRDELRVRLAASQRILARAAGSIAGHEDDPCPLDHPLVGRLRCGEWLLFAGVHDLMHLEQLEALARAIASEAAGTLPAGGDR